MKLFYSQSMRDDLPIEEELATPDLYDDIKKTRYALEVAYAGFDNAVEPDLIDCYIYEINALQKRYNHLLELSAKQQALQENTSPKHSHQKSAIRALVSHVFG